jgi:hypothetical protein
MIYIYGKMMYLSKSIMLLYLYMEFLLLKQRTIQVGFMAQINQRNG